MAHDHHQHNGHKENKPVAFTTPLICGLVAVFIILAFVSLGNPCHHKEQCCTGKECSKECMEKCEKGDHAECKEEKGAHGHGAEAKHEEAHATEHAATAETPAATDSTTKEEPVKEEAHH
jgi:hypothetical protein